MSEEMKLLMALADAMRFDVERIEYFNEALYEKAVEFHEKSRPTLYPEPNKSTHTKISFKVTKRGN